jgi:hypothetical protein
VKCDFPGEKPGRRSIVRMAKGYMLYPQPQSMTNPLLTFFATLMKHSTPAMNTRCVGKKWTIGQETSTHRQDGGGSPQAEFMTGRNITDRRHPYFAVKPSSDS